MTVFILMLVRLHRDLSKRLIMSALCFEILGFFAFTDLVLTLFLPSLHEVCETAAKQTVKPFLPIFDASECFYPP